jgi:hypothetical protein
LPSWYLPAQRAGQPSCRADMYQLSGQVNLLSKLVSTSSVGSSTCLPSWYVPAQ